MTRPLLIAAVLAVTAWWAIGRDLACWCPLPRDGEPDICHAAVLITIASGGDGTCVPSTCSP